MSDKIKIKTSQELQKAKEINTERTARIANAEKMRILEGALNTNTKEYATAGYSRGAEEQGSIANYTH